MEHTLLHTGPVFELYALETERILLAFWHDVTNFNAWLQANKLLILETIDKGYDKYIADVTHCTPISEEQFAYLISDIIPEHRKAGMKNVVFITPDNLQLELITQTMFNKVMPLGFNMLQAKSLQEGLEWLGSQDLA